MMLRIAIIISVFCSTAPAWADALDGDWCNPVDGKLTIDGRVITTPKGNKIEGIYGRHRFEYDAPAGGWNGGQRIIIQQFSETRMQLRAGEKPASEWKPCQVVS